MIQGHSTCDLAYTLVLAIARFAAAIDCVIDVEWIPRCSNPGSTAADFLSKGKKQLACDELNVTHAVTGRYSHTLHAFAAQPVISRTVGQAMAKEASAFMEIVQTSVENIGEVDAVYRRYLD